MLHIVAATSQSVIGPLESGLSLILKVNRMASIASHSESRIVQAQRQSKQVFQNYKISMYCKIIVKGRLYFIYK